MHGKLEKYIWIRIQTKGLSPVFQEPSAHCVTSSLVYSTREQFAEWMK